MTRTEQHLGVVESACVALDGVEEYGIWQGDATGLLVLHGLAMYARDTARSAALLLREGRTLSAAALTRVVIEHAVLAQWLKAEPEGRGQLFLQQGKVEHARWFEVVLDANFDPADPTIASLIEHEKREGLAGRPKNVHEVFQTPKNLFGDTEHGRQLYLTYRNLSRFVHPSAVHSRATDTSHRGVAVANSHRRCNSTRTPRPRRSTSRRRLSCARFRTSTYWRNNCRPRHCCGSSRLTRRFLLPSPDGAVALSDEIYSDERCRVRP